MATYWASCETKKGSCCFPGRAFGIASAVFIIQIFTLVLLAVDVIDLKNEDGNKLGIPSNVDGTVRTSQFIAIFITVISQQEVTVSLNLCFEGRKHITCPSWKWWVSLGLRMVAGILALAVTFMLLMRADTVRDLLLNFTAVEFVSVVDDTIFQLCGWGYFGPTLEKEVKNVKAIKEQGAPENNAAHDTAAVEREQASSNRSVVKEIKAQEASDGHGGNSRDKPVTGGESTRSFQPADVRPPAVDVAVRSPDSKVTRSTWSSDPDSCLANVVRDYRKGIIMTVVFFIILGFWVWLTVRQNRGDYRKHAFYVQFGDEFSPILGTFSGLYIFQRPKRRFFSGRSIYVSDHSGTQARFAYCKKTNKWTFSFAKALGSSPGDPCDDVQVQSSESLSYDITDSASDTWFFVDDGTSRELPLQQFSMESNGGLFGTSCKSTTDCGNETRFVCTAEEHCACTSDWFGSSCQFGKPCDSLETDERHEGFAGTRPWERKYEALKNDDGDPFQLYGRPIYIASNDSDRTDAEVMFFTGRRWVLTRANEINDMPNAAGNHSMIADFFLTTFHGYFTSYDVSFISESVDVRTPADEATPVGLQWFHAVSNAAGHFPDSNRESGAVLICTFCSETDNECFFDATCNDGACDCTATESSGTLCQVAPLSNSHCNLFFNTPEFSYDGQDCCPGTCVSGDRNACGHKVKEFGAQEYIGYPYCIDPEQSCYPATDPCFMTRKESIAGVDAGSGAGASVALAVSETGPVVALTIPGAGTAQVFAEDGSLWVPRGNPFSFDINKANALQLWSSSDIALNGDGTVVVIGWHVNNGNRGVVQAYRWQEDGNTWIQLGEDIIPEETSQGLGWSVTLSEDGYTFATTFRSTNITRVFRYGEPAKWTQLGGDITQDRDFQRLRVSLSSNGDTLAIGVPDTSVSAAGIVKVYEYDSSENSTNWVPVGQELIGGSYMGHGVSLSGDGSRVAVLGGNEKQHSSTNTQYRGNVTVYSRDGPNSTWIPLGQSIETFARGSVSLSRNGRTLAVGDPVNGDITGLDKAGSVRIFEFHDDDGDWEAVGTPIGGTASNDWFGSSISLSSDGSMIACGSPGGDSYSSQHPNHGYASLLWKAPFRSEQFEPSVSSPGDSVPATYPPESTEDDSAVPESTPGSSDTTFITILLQLDDAPEETAFILECDGVSKFAIQSGELSQVAPNERKEAPVDDIPIGADCSVTIEDTGGENGRGNGICCSNPVQGHYKVYYGESASGTLLAQGGRLFTSRESAAFKVDSDNKLVPLTVRLQYEGNEFFTDRMGLACGDFLNVEVATNTLDGTFPFNLAKTDTYLVPEGIACQLGLTCDAVEGRVGCSYNVSLEDGSSATILAAGEVSSYDPKSIDFTVSYT